MPESDSHATAGSPVSQQPRSSAYRRAVLAVFRVVGLAYGGFLIVLMVMETRMVYPGAFMHVRGFADPDVKTVMYTSSDGTKLTGRLYEASGNTETVLYFHGNGTSAAQSTPSIVELGRMLEANVLAAEFRGFDNLDGKPHERGVIQDCFAARDFLADRYQIEPSQLILYGRSLGGGCAVAVAGDSGAKVLVLDRTFDRLVDVAAGQYPMFPVKLLMRNQYDSISRIESYSGPLVQVHGTQDHLIPVENARRLFDCAECDPKEWIEVPGLGHNDLIPGSVQKSFYKRILEAIEQRNSER